MQEYVKNIVDRAAAAALILAALPLFFFAFAVIKLFSRGPVLFTQVRIGRYGQPFTIFKFRTMHLAAGEHEFGSVTVQGDPRVFPGARLLRKFKIDELPQLFNVLNGTMSLIGPRPTVADDHCRMNLQQQQRTRMKPGITGLAQVNGGAALPWPARIELDLQYIRHHSIALDAYILMKTIWLVASGRADTNPPTDDEWADHSSAPTSQSQTPESKAA